MTIKQPKATIPSCIKTEVRSSSLFTPVTAKAGCSTCQDDTHNHNSLAQDNYNLYILEINKILVSYGG